MSGRVNRTIFKFHSYIGLVTGIALLLIGLSGSILVFNEELDHLLYSVSGLTPGLLSITGFLLWWRRKRSNQTVIHFLKNRG